MKTKYDLEKIKKLSNFDDMLKKDLKDPVFKKKFEIATRKLELSHEIMMKRKQAKMTQVEFAKELETSQSFIARVETGNQNITVEVLYRIANLLSRKLKKKVKFSIEGTL